MGLCFVSPNMHQGRSFGNDDLCLSRYVRLQRAQCVVAYLGAASQKYGFNRHVWNIYIPELVSTRQVPDKDDPMHHVLLADRGLIRCRSRPSSSISCRPP